MFAVLPGERWRAEVSGEPRDGQCPRDTSGVLPEHTLTEGRSASVLPSASSPPLSVCT